MMRDLDHIAPEPFPQMVKVIFSLLLNIPGKKKGMPFPRYSENKRSIILLFIFVTLDSGKSFVRMKDLDRISPFFDHISAFKFPMHARQGHNFRVGVASVVPELSNRKSLQNIGQPSGMIRMAVRQCQYIDPS